MDIFCMGDIACSSRMVLQVPPEFIPLLLGLFYLTSQKLFLDENSTTSQKLPTKIYPEKYMFPPKMQK